MYDSSGRDLLEKDGHDVVVVDSSDPADVARELPGCQALWVRTPERVTAAVLDAGADLVVVSTSGFGTDNVDLGAATDRGILVVNHPGFGRIPVAEHTVMLILAAAKRLVWSDAATRDGTAWDQRTDMQLLELEAKPVGLLGMGFIGSEVARKLTVAFGCDVLGYDPYCDPRLPLLAGGRVAASLDELLEHSQVLCLCPELTDETRLIVSSAELSRLPRGAVVVNTSRGQVLDADALADALDSGQVAAAALDVVYPEPLPAGHRLLTDSRVTFTPHTGGLSVETSARLAVSAAKQIGAALAGRRPDYPVNEEAWQRPASRRPSGAAS